MGLNRHMSTLFSFAPAYEHNLIGHPEHAGRGKAVMDLLTSQQVLADLAIVDPVMATPEQVRRAHAQNVIDRAQQISLRGGGQIDADTYATDASYDLAMVAAGATTNAALAVANGEHTNGYVFVRPPGHHAEYSRSMGFCLFNNIAVAAKEVQAKTNCKRLMIVDIDVHHGNGTQDIFYGDDSVLFISTHQFGSFFYPGTGAAHELGQDAASGFNFNVPIVAGVGDAGYLSIMDQLIAPAAQKFKPDMILISAGFDAHWQDPLASMELSLTGYAQLAQKLVSIAQETCEGRILFVQEGGYMLDVLSHAVLNCLNGLLGNDKIVDPFGLSPVKGSPDLVKMIKELQVLHLLK